MKIAIMGGAGFIGSQLAKAYLDAGHTVVVIDNLAHSSRQTIDPRARFYQIDIRDGKLRKILQQERPEIVSHHVDQKYASPTEHALADADIHVRGLLNILDGCVSALVQRCIFASGGSGMYENREGEELAITEESPLNPRSAHDINKATGEWYVRYYTQQFGLKHTILRYADVYGESKYTQTHHAVPYFVSMCLEQRRPIIRGTGNEKRDSIFIEDVVEANLKLLRGGENQTLHISSGKGYSLNELYRLVIEKAGIENDPGAMYISGPLKEVEPIILDNTRAKKLLKWSPQVEIEDGIEKLVQQGQRQQKKSIKPDEIRLEKKLEHLIVNTATPEFKPSSR